MRPFGVKPSALATTRMGESRQPPGPTSRPAPNQSDKGLLVVPERVPIHLGVAPGQKALHLFDVDLGDPPTTGIPASPPPAITRHSTGGQLPLDHVRDLRPPGRADLPR